MQKQDFRQSDAQTISIIDSILNSPVVLQKEKSTWSQAWNDFKRAAEAAEEDKNNETVSQNRIEHV